VKREGEEHGKNDWNRKGKIRWEWRWQWPLRVQLLNLRNRVLLEQMKENISLNVKETEDYRNIPLGNVLCQFNPVSILIPYLQDPLVIIFSNVGQYLLYRELSSHFRIKFVILHVCAIRPVVIILCEFSPLLLYIILLLSSNRVTEIYLFIYRVLFCSIHKSLSL
jgi:hypothetical protein